MDKDGIAGLIIGGLCSVLVGLISYSCATSTMQEQAIAAKAGCWKVDERGKAVFSWDCPKKSEK